MNINPRFRERNNKVLQTGEIVTVSRFFFSFFFLEQKNSISYLCFYIVSFCTFVFIAKHVVSNDLFHWCMPSCIANEIREYQKPIIADYTEAMFSIQLLISCYDGRLKACAGRETTDQLD